MAIGKRRRRDFRRMTRVVNVCALSLALVSVTGAQGPAVVPLQELYERRSWFELRDAIAGASVPPLYRGAVASAFNHVAEAERYLGDAIREAVDVSAANEARGLLAIQHIRRGRSADAGRLLDDILRVAPQRTDVRDLRNTFGALADRPNLRVQLRRQTTFSCDVSREGVRIPVSINGKTVHWLVDTGANISVLSESEAKMLGLAGDGPAGRAADFAGGQTVSRTAVAARVAVGGTELRDVAMLVIPDSQPPWNEFKAGRRGAVGLPVALALGTLRWSSAGTCQMGIGASASAPAEANLVFDWLTPIARVRFEGVWLDLMLDTGNTGGSQLWERFGREFAALITERGQKGMKRLTQVGGSRELEAIVIPELRLRIGGFDTVLQPATVFPKPVGNELRHGNLGMDLLGQASTVTIDFPTMSMTLQ